MDWTLFGSALLSSTLLPGGSEALLLYRLHQGADPLASAAIATAGNVLDSLIAYGRTCRTIRYGCHCERSEAIQRVDQAGISGLLRCAQ